MTLSKISSFKPDNKVLYQGSIIAFVIITLWAVNLILLLSIDISKINLFLIVNAMLWQTFLYTGLFITAHDAMHGTIFPKNPKLNNLIGSASVWLYGLFDYKDLLKKHWLHHKYPGSELDPDYQSGEYKNGFTWYFYFMKNYWKWTQPVGLIIIYNVFTYVLHIPEINLNLFWVIPSLLSSVQLFYFGTFLPHREPENGYTNPHRTQSIRMPIFWSFITCYHFGYHEEHHEYPHVPWWKLPEVSLATSPESINQKTEKT